MKNAYYFILKAFFFLKIFKIFVLTFWSYRKKWLGWKDKVNFKFHDVTAWLTNNYNTHTAQYLIKNNQTVKFGQLIENNRRNIFIQKSSRK